MLLEEGVKAPAFSSLGTNGEKISLKDYSGKWLVLYFYPKDLTPGCTIEANQFQKLLSKFKNADAEVLGVSRDKVEKHAKFTDKCGLEFTLLADEDGTVCEKYGTWQKKSFMGKKFMGIVRVTYLIDPDGKIAKVYSTVKPLSHAKEVLEDLLVLRKRAA